MEPTLSLALVDGERAGAVSGATLDVVNPATNSVIGRIPRCDARDVEVAVAAAKRAAPGWRSTEPQLRAAALLAFADAVAERGAELARLDSVDNGSPLHEMRNDIGLATSQIRYLAGLARTAMAFSRDVEAGYVWVNETSRHYLGAPFGGVKNSGVGREEDLEEIESYTQLKSVNIRFG